MLNVLAVWVAIQITLSTVQTASLVCPDGYWENTAGTTCFTVLDEELTWEEARNRCQSDHNHGDLIVVADEAMNDLITATLSTAGNIDDVLWIGLSDNLEKGVYRWLDNTAEVQYFNWADDSVDDSTREDCVGTQQGSWLDYSCTDTHKALCERPFISCPAGWVESISSGTCLKLFTDVQATWSDARAACHGVLGDLVKIDSDDVSKTVEGYLKDSDAVQLTWIGLHNVDSDGTYDWLDEDRVITYTNWAESEDFSYDCVGVGEEDDNRWTTQDCSVRAQYLCERHSIACNPGWVVGPSAGTCLQFVTEKRTWSSARDVCQSEGGDLVQILDQDTNDLIGDRITANGEQGRHWIGLHDLNGDGNYYWLDDPTPVMYTNWKSGDPDGVGEDGSTENVDCAGIGMVDGSYWTDDNCDIEANFICERLPVLCPVDWLASGTSETCVMYRDDIRTWPLARTACQEDGADLVKILDADMNDFIADLLSTKTPFRTWIGLHDRKEEGNFYWLDETTTPTYTNWADGNPDNVDYSGTGTGQDCVEMGFEDNKLWSDYFCDIYTVYICEKPPITCVDGWSPSVMSGTCLKHYTNLETWDKASETCQQDGGELVKILDERMNNYVGFLVEENFLAYTSWIGIHDPDGTGVFVWNDESDVPYYMNWADGEPANLDAYGNPSANGKNCAQIGWEDANMWHTDVCSAFTTFICERPSETALTFPDPTVKPSEEVGDNGETPSSSAGLSGGAIFGVIVAVLAVSGAIGFVVWRYRKQIHLKLTGLRWLRMDDTVGLANPDTHGQELDSTTIFPN